MPTLANLVCPKCHGPLTGEPGRELHCRRDGTRYPVVDGIPSFMMPAAEPMALAGCALSLILPALNEAQNLDRVLPELKKALAALGPTHEIIVVDGGSTDGTQEVVRKHEVRLVSQKLPGFGGAYRAGFEQARGEYLLTLDADGSHDPAFLGDLWKARGEGDVVIASRYVAGGAAEMPGWRRLLSRILNVTFGRGLSLPVHDLSSGFRLYHRAVLRDLKLKGTDFDVLEEILIRALAAGYRVHEVPFRYRARVAGRSHARLFKFALSYLKTFLAMWRPRHTRHDRARHPAPQVALLAPLRQRARPRLDLRAAFCRRQLRLRHLFRGHRTYPCSGEAIRLTDPPPQGRRAADSRRPGLRPLALACAGVDLRARFTRWLRRRAHDALQPRESGPLPAGQRLRDRERRLRRWVRDDLQPEETRPNGLAGLSPLRAHRAPRRTRRAGRLADATSSTHALLEPAQDLLRCLGHLVDEI